MPVRDRTAEGADLALTPLELDKVKVGGRIGRRIEITMRRNLLPLDLDKDFLAPFRDKKLSHKDTGYPTYIGLGKLIDATAKFAAGSGDPQILAFKSRLVSETLKQQLSDGYLGIFREDSRINTLWDVHEMVYLIYGLVTDWRLFDDEASLQAAKRIADYIMNKRPGEAVDAREPVNVSKLNLERAFIALGEAGGRREYIDYANWANSLVDWNPRPTGRVTFHSYTYLNLCLAQLDLYRLDPNPKLLDQTRRLLGFLTSEDGLVINGACSQSEAWHTDQDGNNKLGESCADAYLVRLLGRLLAVEGDSRYGDLMERTIYNALFAAQSPDGRRLRYFTPFEDRRVYFEHDTFCCPNNYRRIIAELPSLIYYHSPESLAINLYTASSAKLEMEGGVELAVRQETDYPNSGKIVIELDPSKPIRFLLQLRIPSWCAKAQIRVNGRPVEQGGVVSGSFFGIRREWKGGDRVEMEMAMSWRLVKGRKLQAMRVAVMRGPQLFCLSPARNSEALSKANPWTIKLAPSSLEGPIKDETVGPDGLACRLKAWSFSPYSKQQPTDLQLTLTEFADPDGQNTYFRLPELDQDQAVEDELVRLMKE